MRRRSGASSLPRPCPPLPGNRYAARAHPREQTCRSAGTARRAEQARRGTDTPRTGARGPDAPGGLTGRRCGAEQMRRGLACEEQTCRKAARRRRSGRRNRCATMLRAPPAERLRRERAREEQTRRHAAKGSEEQMCRGTDGPRTKLRARRRGAERICRGTMRRRRARCEGDLSGGTDMPRNKYAASPRAGSPPRCGREPDMREQICRASAQASFSAWSRSARMSSICSMPIDRRT